MSVSNFLILNKEIGETPLECMERFRALSPEYEGLPMTYAGRLDPMAEGVLLVLVGEECKNKDKYLGLDKEYEVEILFGFATDTYDILGKINSARQGLAELNIFEKVRCFVGENLKIESEKINTEIQKFKGKFVQEYPAYSSKTVDGVQLHTLANKGVLPDEMPTKEVEIYDIQMLEEREIDSKTLLKEIKNNISKVKGDFRQKEILVLWQNTLARLNLTESRDAVFKIMKIKVSCSSGTYMRSLAHNLGQKLGVPALAYSIKRTRVGGYLL